MNQEIVFKSVFGLAALWFFLAYFWRDYRIDALRDELFGLRDQLFMYAAERNIDFDNPAYAILRERMNALIRFAHEFTLTKFLIAVLVISRDRDYWQRGQHPWLLKWEESVKQLPEPARSVLISFNSSLLFAMLKHMVYRSFFLYLVIRPLAPLVRIFRSEVVTNPQVVSGVERLESDALDQDARRVGKALAAA